MPVSTILNTKNKRTQNVVSALTARTQLGQILRRASEHDERFVVDRRGKPSVVIMGVRDYLRNIAPTPAAYRAIRREAEKSGSSFAQHGRDQSRNCRHTAASQEKA